MNTTLDKLFYGYKNAQTLEEGFVTFFFEEREETWKALKGLRRDDFNYLIDEVEEFLARERQVDLDMGSEPIFSEVTRDEVADWLCEHNTNLVNALEKSLQEG